MKQLLVFSFLVITTWLYSQDRTAFNKIFKISDSLIYPTEIRVYQNVSPTNYSSLFRMYKDAAGVWQAAFFEHWSVVANVMEEKSKKRQLYSKNKMQYVYLNFIRSHIDVLPDENDIRWKLEKRGQVKYFTRISKGEEVKELDYLSTQSMPLDGKDYYFMFTNHHKSNSFYFGDPSWHRDKYPEVDEPQFVQEILEIIRSEFGIWQ